MRRLLAFAVALVAVLGVIVPPAMAQAPAPKVTITGLVDQVGTYARNISAYDFNLNKSDDKQAYGRTRGRFDIIGEVGRAKAVLGLEIDAYWGQTGFIDSNMGPGCVGTSLTGTLNCGAVGSGAESSFDLNTDTQGSIQVKWLYTEFPLPLIPFDTVVRLGGQPFGTAATYKLAAYANGDFPGVNLVSTLAPGAKLILTYVQVDENLTGKKDLLPFKTGVITNAFSAGSAGSVSNGRCTLGGDALNSNCVPQSRNDNFAVIASMEFSPFKGLDVKPMYSYFHAEGLTSGSARQGRGGLPIVNSISGVSGNQTGFSPWAPVGALGAAAIDTLNTGNGTFGADGAGTGIQENRHTIGVDARFTAGPFSLQPTVLYQFGSRDAVIVNPSNATGNTLNQYGIIGRKYTADINAWLVDVRAGFNVGPLALGGMVMWTSGDPAKSNPFKHVGFFQPLDTDTGYLADWGTQIMSLGIDYYQILNGGAAQAGLNPGVAIGYDKYGRLAVGAKAAYSITPALTFGLGAQANWTDKSVDTDGVLVTNGGILPSFLCRSTGKTCRPEGDSDYLGTEVNLSMTYRFAPGLTFDVAGGYLFAGNALGHRFPATAYGGTGTNSGGTFNQPPTSRDIGVNDVMIGTARVRYQF